MCAVSQIGDSCKVDSGGGLVRLGRYYQLIGVVSYGIGCNSTVQGVKIPGVYARVSSVLDWIEKKTASGRFCRRPSGATILPTSEVSPLPPPSPSPSPSPSTGWGPWSPFSQCSKPCGVGKKTRDRFCQDDTCRRSQQTQERICNPQKC